MLLNAGLPADLFKSELNGELCGLLNTWRDFSENNAIYN
jgi:hypothetical protein